MWDKDACVDMYVHVCVCTCVYVHVCVHVNVCICVCVCAHTPAQAIPVRNTYICECVCMWEKDTCVDMYVHVCVCVFVCTYTSTGLIYKGHIHVCVYTYVGQKHMRNIWMCACVCVCVCVWVCVCVCVHIRQNRPCLRGRHTIVCVCVCVCGYVCVYVTQPCTCIYVSVRVSACMYSYTPTTVESVRDTYKYERVMWAKYISVHIYTCVRTCAHPPTLAVSVRDPYIFKWICLLLPHLPPTHTHTCPTRKARSTAWASVAGFQDGS